MLTLLEQRGYFTGASDQNAYKHLKGFVDICWGSKKTNVSKDALRLRLFPLFLRGKAFDWLERLPNHSITTWDELADKFIAKFFSPSHMAALRDEILAFKQEPTKPLHEIWERYKAMVKECPKRHDRGYDSTNLLSGHKHHELMHCEPIGRRELYETFLPRGM